MSVRTIHLGADERPLEGGWTMLLTEGGRYSSPSEVHRPAARLPAPVPGTVASALSAAGLFDVQDPQPLADKDAWYFRSLEGEAPGEAILRFEGLATIADIYINSELRLRSESMFAGHDLPVILTGADEIALCFRALAPHLEQRGPRARWRPRMFDHQGLRLVRTTLLGHMPGWCPSVHAIGPWRPISILRPAHHRLTNLRLTATLGPQGQGRLAVAFDLAHPAEVIEIECAGRSLSLTRDGDSHWQATLDVPDIEHWWPHTHGKPRLYNATIEIDGERHSLGLVGFRSISVERGADGRDFKLLVNGEPVFCRGAVWTNADIVGLPGDAAAYAPWLAKAAEAGMNMIRIGGTMTYESADFFRLCDRLGLLVWQDLMFANFDYPATDGAFSSTVRQELEHLLQPLQASPSLAVICGGSEVYQQGAMLGLPERTWRGDFFAERLGAIAADLRPDCIYVENSPSGGAMPFSPDAGISHYYGVGAYCRPLEDARRAEVRFAAECLAFAHVPQQSTLDTHLPVPAVHNPRWKARVPRDRDASWDFEDVRDHYLALLYGVDPARQRRQDPARYLDLSRAVTGEVVGETFAEWRRPGSTCNGALVWTLQDLLPGAGWGVIDSTGEPKPVWYAMRRAFRPVQVLLTDEGTNGLSLHAINESANRLDVEISLSCLRDGRQAVISGRMAISLEARESRTLAATDLFGAFFDTTYSFRFGPPSHEVTVATLTDLATGEIISEAFHFPLGRGAAMFDAELTAEVVQEDGRWWLDLSTERFAQSVHLEIEGFRAEDDWFHLAPGRRRIALLRRDGVDGKAVPKGEAMTLGSTRRCRI